MEVLRRYVEKQIKSINRTKTKGYIIMKGNRPDPRFTYKNDSKSDRILLYYSIPIQDLTKKKKYKKVCLSIDTRKSEIMIEGIKYGVDLINDVSGFSYDKKLLSNLRNYNISKVLHHMQGTPNTMQKNPKYKNVLLDIYDFFEKNINKKFNDNKIIIDPGIGFGKNLKHNLTLISKISLFHSLGFPILVGTSRKRFISQISGKHDSKDRIGGTLASVLFLLSQGVQIFRVHNVNEVKQGILVFKKILLN